MQPASPLHCHSIEVTVGAQTDDPEVPPLIAARVHQELSAHSAIAIGRYEPERQNQSQSSTCKSRQCSPRSPHSPHSAVSCDHELERGKPISKRGARDAGFSQGHGGAGARTHVVSIQRLNSLVGCTGCPSISQHQLQVLVSFGDHDKVAIS